MRIAFFASSLVSAYWNGAATYYRGLLKALAERGHDIAFYEPDAFERQAHRDIDDPEWARVVVYPPPPRSRDRRPGQCRRCGGDRQGERRRRVRRTARGRGGAPAGAGRTVIFWDVDAPATLERVAADPRDPFRALIPRYDLILTYGGGQAVVDAYRALGAATCVPIYNALDPSTHHPCRGAPFRSGPDVHRQSPARPRGAGAEFFLEPARQLPDRRFILAGNGWSDLDLPPNVRALGHVYTWEHNRLNVSARAVLNVNRASMARFGFSPPTRVFEAAGAGACLITDRWPGIEAFLEPGSEILVADDGAQVVELLRSLAPERARAIGARRATRCWIATPTLIAPGRSKRCLASTRAAALDAAE